MKSQRVSKRHRLALEAIRTTSSWGAVRDALKTTNNGLSQTVSALSRRGFVESIHKIPSPLIITTAGLDALGRR